jgi:hypothetical protein
MTSEISLVDSACNETEYNPEIFGSILPGSESAQ